MRGGPGDVAADGHRSPARARFRLRPSMGSTHPAGAGLVACRTPNATSGTAAGATLAQARERVTRSRTSAPGAVHAETASKSAPRPPCASGRSRGRSESAAAGHHRAEPAPLGGQLDVRFCALDDLYRAVNRDLTPKARPPPPPGRLGGAPRLGRHRGAPSASPSSNDRTVPALGMPSTLSPGPAALRAPRHGLAVGYWRRRRSRHRFQPQRSGLRRISMPHLRSWSSSAARGSATTSPLSRRPPAMDTAARAATPVLDEYAPRRRCP